MNAFDCKKIADNYWANRKKKKEIITKRRTAQFFKFILKLVKKQTKKGYYFVDIPKDVDYVDYEFIYNKLDDLKFDFDRNYTRSVFRIKWVWGRKNGS